MIEKIYKMPRRKKRYKHKDNISKMDQLFNSMVARPVGKAEMSSTSLSRRECSHSINPNHGMKLPQKHRSVG